MVSIGACILWCILSAAYVGSVVLFSFTVDLKDETLGYKIFVYTVCFTPLNMIFIIIFTIVELCKIIEDKIGIKKIIDRYRRKKIIERERKKKIKSGIIKLSPFDPYGEENWNE
jgi:hypothetical protein